MITTEPPVRERESEARLKGGGNRGSHCLVILAILSTFDCFFFSTYIYIRIFSMTVTVTQCTNSFIVML